MAKAAQENKNMKNGMVKSYAFYTIEQGTYAVGNAS